MNTQRNNGIRVFTTMRRKEGESQYSASMNACFSKTEQYGFNGTLIFQNNSNDVDPWVMAQELLMRSYSLLPFVAINPVYMHPYTAALKMLSLGELYKRKLYLNFITGTSLSELQSMETMPNHEDRYIRLTEYIEIIIHLLSSSRPLSYEGKFYRTKNLRLPHIIDKQLFPELFIAGSSEDANKARSRTGACKVGMAKPVNEIATSVTGEALHFGIVAGSAPETAREKMINEFSPRYPEAKQLLEFSMQNTDAVWKKELAGENEDEVFRLEPFKHFNADCPYLVGSYEQVAGYVSEYIRRGTNTFIIEVNENDMECVHSVMEIVKQNV